MIAMEVTVKQLPFLLAILILTACRADSSLGPTTTLLSTESTTAPTAIPTDEPMPDLDDIENPPIQLLSTIQSQYGVTLTVVTTEFSPSFTIIDTLIQVDFSWQMDPTAFPPQQALAYPTVPDSLFDNQGRTIPSTSREGELPIIDPETGGFQQIMHNYWQAVEPDAEIVTATLMVELNSLHRQITLPIDWDNHQAGDLWDVDFPLEIGFVLAQVQQVEWLETLANDRVRLRLTVISDSQDDIRLACLHLDTADPWQRTCANFEGELTYTVDVRAGEPAVLHLRANVELLTPFQLSLKPT